MSNRAVNMIPEAAAPQAFTDEAPNAVSVIVNAVNVTPKPADVEASNNIFSETEMESLITHEIDGLLSTLLRTEIEDLRRQVDIQCNVIVLAATEKFRLEKEIEAKEKELENLVPKPEVEVIMIDDDDDDLPPPPSTPMAPLLKCGFCSCDDFALEGREYCADPEHYYDGFAQPLPNLYDLEFEVTPPSSQDSASTLLPSLDTSFSSSLDLHTASPMITSTPIEPTPDVLPPSPTPDVPSPTPDVPPSPAPSSSSTSILNNQIIPRSLLPVNMKKRSYVFKCYERCCDLPEMEGMYFCEDHYPSNQLGHPEHYNAFHGITTPIKRQKIFIPLLKTRRRNKPLSKYRAIKPKL